MRRRAARAARWLADLPPKAPRPLALDRGRRWRVPRDDSRGRARSARQARRTTIGSLPNGADPRDGSPLTRPADGASTIGVRISSGKAAGLNAGYERARAGDDCENAKRQPPAPKGTDGGCPAGCYTKRLRNLSAVSATSRQPLSIVNACPRFGISTIS